MTSLRYPELEVLWYENDPDALSCCVCGELIAPEAIIRTFRLQPLRNDHVYRQQPSRTISVPDKSILLYDRHLKCAVDAKYIAVSHVWDSDLAIAQKEGRTGTPSERTQVLVYTLPLRIYDSVADQLGSGRELWHDYISVPQWIDKRKILAAIPDIFKLADFTLVHLDDVPRVSVERLRSETPDDRIMGVTGVCNARWFRRVWTAMEFIRSTKLHVLLEDYHMADGGGDLFFSEMNAIWDEEVERRGSVYEIERLIGARASKNLVPWMLGPLQDIRAHKSTVFAHAFSLLSTRQCSQPHDFFYAILGLLSIDLEETKLHDDDREACAQIARACMDSGDYSPLLMTPRNPNDYKFNAYHDVNVWGLGAQSSTPSVPDGLRVQPRGGLVLKAEKIGTVTACKRLSMSMTVPSWLVHVIQAALDCSGPDLNAFVATVGTRICGQDTQEILERLAHRGGRERLQKTLVEWHDSETERRSPQWMEDRCSSITRAMGLSDVSLWKGAKFKGESPMAFVSARGRTIHGHWCSVFAAACPVCHKHFLYRAALTRPPSEVLGAAAYRIPGLSYELALKDGVGIIVKDGHIIGRMVWACPACPCHMMERVEVRFPDLLMPMPNMNMYAGK
ncbi:hypothetical protein SLS58_007988 [Diplodia intermedia]|uniref:Heterokaryon incompatibility domain-containing protein n=1 Tax=Diplodia intermedia TaxID=856260 RepID=A0ABR3TJ19_9PEZI